jgi:hypothetical protein
MKFTAECNGKSLAGKTPNGPKVNVSFQMTDGQGANFNRTLVGADANEFEIGDEVTITVTKKAAEE